MESESVRWLFMEGLIPLLGAGALFLLWGICRFAVASDKSKFTYAWPQALDPLGWLYGAVIIAFQAGWKGVGISGAGVLPYVCFAAAAICLLLLISAMTERGALATWEPPTRLKVCALLLVLGILYSGFSIHNLAVSGAKS
jgi:hypothetical protein